MHEQKISTADRILQAALQLMKDKGFNLVTIKEIADAANVSEMTVFRHFETKKGVLEAAIEKNKVVPSFKHTFTKHITWELEQDLSLIAHAYLDVMEGNESICLIAIQERFTLPELADLISDHTEQLKVAITEYFDQMQAKGKMMTLDSYTQASMFLAMLFSFFMSTALWEKRFINMAKEEFIANSVRTFCHGIKKQ
ncbi:TetR/AcrR family transcriptional regulator [Gracilibacillus alcaliphilus]|uniref:TetR/AcrR family transcriptional regulator n=1 Tax=Gracilibacillus alcaliphilus TaxID=1401441 RepID=UPI001957AFC5|nr:TetR/AcrR family transcriptional regulator [Gracilibacillus alcaliphilus]MBM7675293.1 AcrR family transcriptional regulator [Gracilibacillus alcaliphilus]